MTKRREELKTGSKKVTEVVGVGWGRGGVGVWGVVGKGRGGGWGCGGEGRGNVTANFSRLLDRKKSHGHAVLWLFNRCTYQI